MRPIIWAAFIALLAVVGYQYYQLDKTPVKYLICGSMGEDCFVTARYQTLRDCEYALRLNSALCDSVSVPGKITCVRDDKPSTISSSYCTY
jgi:hypothetical protein